MTRTAQRTLLVLSAACAIAAPSVGSAQLAGVVRHSETLEPVAGARVTARAFGAKTLTNLAGEFVLDNANIADADSAELTAAAVGYYIAVQSVQRNADAGAFDETEILIEPVPVSDGSDFTFQDPDTCERCHESIYADWQRSAMAKAGDNTWVDDIYNGDGTAHGSGGFVYTRDSKLKDSNPNSECAACHEPERWLNEPGADITVDDLDPGSMHGISCAVCHRVASIDVSKANFPGVHKELVTMTLAKDDEPIVVQYGPLDDVSFERPNSMRAAYQPQMLSELCAACHQDKNDPDEDGDFEEENGVVSEPTYEEWVQSSYGDPNSLDHQSCAGCHMKVSNADSACMDVTPTPPRQHGELREHTFEGSTAEYLENAVTLSMSVADVDGNLAVEVSVHNDRTGHHVPTGVTIRNMILLVEAVRLQDGKPLTHLGEQLVHDLGGVGAPEDGYYAGRAGKLFAKINHDEDGKSPVFFSEATGITSDTRIPAKATDVTSYEFAPPDEGGEVEVRARLIYRRSWRLLADAKRWTEDGHGNPLEDMLPPYFGHLMEQSSVRFDFGGRSSNEADAGPTARPDAGRDAGDASDGDAGPKQDGELADGGGKGSLDAGSEDEDSSDCSCRAAGARSRGAGKGLAALALACVASLVRRRRRRGACVG